MAIRSPVLDKGAAHMTDTTDNIDEPLFPDLPDEEPADYASFGHLTASIREEVPDQGAVESDALGEEPVAAFIDPNPVTPSPGWLSGEPEQHVAEPDAAVDVSVETDVTDFAAMPAHVPVTPLAGDTVEFDPVTTDDSGTEAADAHAQEALEFLTAYDLGGPRELEGIPEPQPKRVLWLVMAVLAAVVAFASGFALWHAARPVGVPDLSGRGPAEATQMLNDFSLRLGSVSEIPTDSVAPGTVVTQKPEAGERLTAGERVSIVIAVSPDRAKVPAVVGRMRESAVSAAVTSKLVPRIVESFSATVGEGTVIEQLPAAGVELGPGEPMVIVVSKGPVPTTVTVPRLDGLTEAEANQLLAANRLKGVFYQSYDTSVPSGDIVGQTPLARTGAPLGSIVQVLVSQGMGSTNIVVPNVAGDTEKNAVAGIEAAGLKASVTKTASASVAAGRVISQMPGPGRGVASGATVGLLVSTGPASDATVPDLKGQGTVAATEAIKVAGLEPVIVQVTVAGTPADQVWAQYPQAGQPAPAGYPMVVMVTRATAQ